MLISQYGTLAIEYELCHNFLAFLVVRILPRFIFEVPLINISSFCHGVHCSEAQFQVWKLGWGGCVQLQYGSVVSLDHMHGRSASYTRRSVDPTIFV
jgi:hypothetical protein